MNNPQFVISLKNRMTVVENDTRLMSDDNLSEMPKLLNYVIETGMANFSLMGTLKKIWASYVTKIMRKDFSKPDHSKLMELTVQQSFSIMFGLPFVAEAVLSKMGSTTSCAEGYQKVTDAEIASGFTKLETLIKGAAKPGNFWFMRKLTTDLSKTQKQTLPNVHEIKMALKCVKRFAHTA